MRHHRLAAFFATTILAAGLPIIGCRSSRALQPEQLGQVPDAGRPIADLANQPLYKFTEGELGRYLANLHDGQPDVAKRVVQLARQNIGQPYEIYLLGEFPFETLDADPIYCLQRSDCLTFCEHTFSAALSNDWWSYLSTLQRLRYRGGKVSMVTRNHYTIADWDRNNAYLFEDMTPRLGGGDVAVPLTQVCRRSRFFAQFGVGQDIPDEPIRDTYIPKDRVASITGELRDGDFVNIIRGDASSQWAGHTGMIGISPDGVADFIHSARPAVREQPLVEYVQSDKRCVGIKILRLRDGAQQIIRDALASSPEATPISADSLNAALARLREEAPKSAKPLPQTWPKAMRLQTYRLPPDVAVNADLQSRLESIDKNIGDDLDIPADERAVGVLDLNDLRLAMVRPDDMFYAASVPKICILLTYFKEHPEAARSLDPGIASELGRMIKLSDNELAAKYGQQLGMKTIQKVINSRPYSFYDKEHGGGLWYGKHYNRSSPREGDPLHDHSHGATVRQLLRYYLMLEQGRLVNGPASQRMKMIFASPQFEHLGHNFVAGLTGRNVSLIRKSGTWEDWHLDTARIQHGDRAYLLVGMTHHLRGEEYLSRIAAAVDAALCGPADEAPFVHTLIVQDHPWLAAGAQTSGTAGVARSGAASEATRRQAVASPAAEAAPGVALLTCPMPEADSTTGQPVEYVSPPIEAATPFNEALLSWNVEAPPNVGYTVDLRVGENIEDFWSPWMTVATWGENPPAATSTNGFDRGKIDVDYFRSDETFDEAQYRVRAACNGAVAGCLSSQPATLRIARVALCLSDTTGRPVAVPRDQGCNDDAIRHERVALDVPFRTQHIEPAALADEVCAPTALSMVLEYYGANRPTREVVDRIFDARHGIYGNWPDAIECAYSYGVPGRLARFSNWCQVYDTLQRGQPIIISVTANDKELKGAPWGSTVGHLMVLTGLDGKGNALVNDPALRDAAKGRRKYAMADLENVWLRRKAGTAYVLERPATTAQTSCTSPNDEPLVDISHVDPRIVLDIRYSTPHNFVGQTLYPVSRALLRESIAQRLRRVQDSLVRRGLGLKVYDAYRPRSVQQKLWDVMPNPDYVARPSKGSRHNRGTAVDVTLVDSHGRELEMPSGYDDFTPAAHRDFAGGSEQARHNRDLLIEAMEAEGFHCLESEWWHYDAPNWEEFPLLDVPLAGGLQEAKDDIAAGRFADAEAILKPMVADAEAPIVDEPARLLEIMRRIRRDYSFDAARMLEQVRGRIPDATAADVERWRDEGALQYRVIDGAVCFFRREPSNLVRFCPEARKRWREHAGDDAGQPEAWQKPLVEHLASLAQNKKESDGPLINPLRQHLTYTIRVHKDNPRLKKGAKIRCWMPFPQEYRQQQDVRLVRCDPEDGYIAPKDAPQRTIYFKRTVDDPSEPVVFQAEYEFTTYAYCPMPNAADARDYDTSSELYKTYTAERLPHIRFSEEVKRLAGEITAGVTNPLEKARRIFLWECHNMRYCAEVEYSTIPSISAKGLATRRGDCGVQALTFITLCRAAGVPARWQSGWTTIPVHWNMHDWAEIYVEPWGWLPVDPSYGLTDSDDPRVREFFFGNQDPYRLIVNLDFGRELDPPKTSFRSEPADFQRGEVEIDGHNLYFDDWDWDYDVRSEPIESTN